MPRGGSRPNAGRKPGVPNKITAEKREELAASGELPLDYMLRVMRDDTKDARRRDEMAKAAAPYLHPRLESVQHSGETTVNVKGETVDRPPRETFDEWQSRRRRELAAGSMGTAARATNGSHNGRLVS